MGLNENSLTMMADAIWLMPPLYHPHTLRPGAHLSINFCQYGNKDSHGRVELEPQRLISGLCKLLIRQSMQTKSNVYSYLEKKYRNKETGGR